MIKRGDINEGTVVKINDHHFDSSKGILNIKNLEILHYNPNHNPFLNQNQQQPQNVQPQGNPQYNQNQQNMGGNYPQNQQQQYGSNNMSMPNPTGNRMGMQQPAQNYNNHQNTYAKKDTSSNQLKALKGQYTFLSISCLNTYAPPDWAIRGKITSKTAVKE